MAEFPPNQASPETISRARSCGWLRWRSVKPSQVILQDTP
jgi:hypothetical protein